MIKNPRDVGRESAWRIGKIYYHTRESGIWVAPRHPKSLEGRTPAAIAAKAIRLLKKQNLKYLGTVDKVAVDDAPSARKRIHRLFLYNIKNSKPHRYDFRRAYANAIHRVLSSHTGLIHPNGRELLPERKLQAKRVRQTKRAIALRAQEVAKAVKALRRLKSASKSGNIETYREPTPKAKPKSKSPVRVNPDLVQARRAWEVTKAVKALRLKSASKSGEIQTYRESTPKSKPKSKSPVRVHAQERKTTPKAKSPPPLHAHDILECHLQSCGKRAQFNGYNVLTLPRGALLFRGVGKRKGRWVLTDARPDYFSDAAVAMGYAKEEKACQVYVLSRPAHLLILTDPDNLKKLLTAGASSVPGRMKRLLQTYTGYGITDLKTHSCQYHNKPVSQIRICTEGYLDDAAQKEDHYISLDLAMQMCDNSDLGVDGWWVPPGSFRSRGRGFHNEVVLCKPHTFARQRHDQNCEGHRKDTPRELYGKAPWFKEEPSGMSYLMNLIMQRLPQRS
jgi:hypothetical protein